MIARLAIDRLARPDLFVFGDGISRTELEAWLRWRHRVVPADLQELLLETCGGELFESEEILTPERFLRKGSVSGTIEAVGEILQHAERRSDFLPFHKGGMGVTVLSFSERKVVMIPVGTSLSAGTALCSLDEWYEMIRAEFAPRYGL